jgi:hypothetical protein
MSSLLARTNSFWAMIAVDVWRGLRFFQFAMLHLGEVEMKKNILIGSGAIVALLGGLAFAGVQWAQTQALANVDNAFARLRAEGATASHGPVELDVWSRTLRIKDIAVATISPPVSVTATEVKAAGINPWSPNGSFAAARLEVTGIETKGTIGGDGSTFNYKIPSAVVADVQQITPPAEPAGTNATGTSAKWGAAFASFRANSVAIPTITVAATMPLPPPAPAEGRPVAPAAPGMMKLNYTYLNLRFDGLDDGRIAKLAVDKLSFKSEGDQVAGTFNDIRSADMDMLPYFGVGLARRKAENGYYKVQGKSTLGSLSMTMPEGGAFDVAGITSDGLGLDPAKISLPKMLEMLPLLNSFNGATAGTPPTSQQMTFIGGFLSDLYEGMQIANFELRGITMGASKAVAPGASTPGNLRVDRIAVVGFEQGKLGSFRIEGVAVDTPDGKGKTVPFKLGVFSIKGLAVARMMRSIMALAAKGGQPTPEDFHDFPSFIEAVEMANLSGVNPTTGDVLQIDRLAAQWGQFINGMPADGRLTLKGRIPVDAADPRMALLAITGLNVMDFTIDIGSAYNAAGKTLVFTPLEVSMVGLGGFTGQVTLKDVPAQAFSMAPGVFNSAALGFNFAAADLNIKDDGMIALGNMVLSGQAQGQGGAPAPALADIVGGMRQENATSRTPSAMAGAVLDGVIRYVAKPGQTLTLQLRPKVPISLLEIVAGAAAPEHVPALLDQFTIKALVTR